MTSNFTKAMIMLKEYKLITIKKLPSMDKKNYLTSIKKREIKLRILR